VVPGSNPGGATKKQRRCIIMSLSSLKEVSSFKALKHLESLITAARFWPKWAHSSLYISKKVKSTDDSADISNLWNVRRLYESIAEEIIERNFYRSVASSSYRDERLVKIRRQIKALGMFIYKIAAHEYVDILFCKYNDQREIKNARDIFERAIEVYAICLRLGFPEDGGFVELKPDFLETNAAWLVGASLALEDNMFDQLARRAEAVVNMKTETEKSKADKEAEETRGTIWIVYADYKNILFDDEEKMRDFIIDVINKDDMFRGFPTVLKIERKEMKVAISKSGLVLE
jgi:hypothetical protein